MCSGQCEASEADEPVTLAVAVPLALASAGLFAVGTAVQQRAAVAHPGTDQGHVRLILSLARRPAWLLSNLALIAGVVLHGVALSKGTLVVVQPLLVSGLLFTMPLSARLHRRRVTLAQWLVAIVTVVGLALFLLLSRGSSGHLRPDLDANRSGIVVAAVTLSVVGVTALAAAVVAGTAGEGGPVRGGLGDGSGLGRGGAQSDHRAARRSALRRVPLVIPVPRRGVWGRSRSSCPGELTDRLGSGHSGGRERRASAFRCLLDEHPELMPVARPRGKTRVVQDLGVGPSVPGIGA